MQQQQTFSDARASGARACQTPGPPLRAGLLFVMLFGQPPEVHTDDPLRAIMAGFHVLQVLAGSAENP